MNRNIGLEEQNEHILSSYSLLNSGNQYEINEDSSHYCQSTLKSLTTGQKQICLLHADHMPIVIQGILSFKKSGKLDNSYFSLGASKSIEECQYQFQDRHWNCSTVRDGTVFGPVLSHGKSLLIDRISSNCFSLANRETALTHAMFSAGITYAVSRACKQGLLKSCTCSRTARPKNLPRDWSWGGLVDKLSLVIHFNKFSYSISCGDNIDYGYRFGQDFVDTPEKEIDSVVQYNPFINTNRTFYGGRKRKIFRRGRIRRQMNIHNNEVGRRVS